MSEATRDNHERASSVAETTSGVSDDDRLHEGTFDYLIIGAGPAGLQAAWFMKQRSWNFAVLEASTRPGTFFEHYPRDRILISVNKRYTGFDDPELNLRWDWNSLLSDDPSMRVTSYSKRYFPHADELCQYLRDYAEKFSLPVHYSVRIARITRSDRDAGFVLYDDADRTWRCRRLIIATGLGLEVMLDIPGIEHAETYGTVSFDPEDFNGQRVLILGKGNSAFEVAKNLLSTTTLIHVASPRPLTMAWRSHHAGHLRAINMELLDTYQLKCQNALINGQIKRIRKTDDGLLATIAYGMADGEVEHILYDRVVSCAGFRFDARMFAPDVKPTLCVNDRFPALHPWYESMNVPGMYFAGTVTQSRDFKQKQSAFIHGFRYNIDFLVRWLAARQDATPLAHERLPVNIETWTTSVLDVMNASHALWQQTGYMCDVWALDIDAGCIRHYRGIPMDYVLAGSLKESAPLLVGTLEFGQERIDDEKNVFAIERVHKTDAERAALSTAIHPVLRLYRGGAIQRTHHIVEDFESVWREPEHILPLRAFLDEVVRSLHRNSMNDPLDTPLKIESSA